MNMSNRILRTPEEGRVQTSLRLKASLFHKLRERAKQAGQSINSQIEALVAESVARAETPSTPGEDVSQQAALPVAEQTATPSTPTDRTVWQLRQFVRCLPIVALIRHSDGRTVLANDELKKLVGRENVVGLRPSDYWGSPAAEWVEAHDKVVREKKTAILCVERIPVKNTVQERFAVRFPICDRAGVLKMTGALGFDLEELRDAEILKPREGGRRPCRVEADRRLVYWSDYGQGT